MKHFDEAEKITEVTAAEYLDNLRSRIHDYIELSFPTISAYKENAAMMQQRIIVHYYTLRVHFLLIQADSITEEPLM